MNKRDQKQLKDLTEAIKALKEEVTLLRAAYYGQAIPAPIYPALPPAYPGYNPWPTIYCNPPINTSWV